MAEENIVQLGIVGPNKTDIIGYYTAQESAVGYDLVGNEVQVNFCVTIPGTGDIADRVIKMQHKITFQEFQRLKDGKHEATVELVPFEAGNSPPASNTEDVDDIPAGSAPSKRAHEYRSDKSYEPKRKSKYNTRLGTSGKKKYYKGVDGNIEVSFVDIVELAHEKCGSKKLKDVYDWARQNIITEIDGQVYPINFLKNWEASIRQNRSKAKNFTPKSRYSPSSEPSPSKVSETEDANGIGLLEMEGCNAELQMVYEDDYPYQSGAESNKLMPNAQYAAEYSDMGAIQYIDRLKDEIISTVETYERSKIPIANSLPCRIPNPHTINSEPRIEFGFN